MKQILVIAALVCFVMATFGFSPAHFAMVPLGLALWVASGLVS